jgi:hypothetical protein
MENNLQMVMNQVQELHTKLDMRAEEQKKTQEALDELEQYSRRASLRIRGIGPFNENDDYTNIVLQLARDMQVELNVSVINLLIGPTQRKFQINS